MPTLTPTKSTGSTTKTTPMVYAEPAQLMTLETLTQFMPGSGLNGAFLAEVFSGVLAHERCGRHLYKTCEARTNSSALRDKYQEFGAETERHVEILEQLIADAGGSPQYVGPNARMILGSDTNLVEATYKLAGSLDLVTAEFAMLDAVFLAESMDHANWSLLAQLATQLEGTPWAQPVRDAVDQVLEQEEQHVAWSRGTKAALVTSQASSDGIATLSENEAELAALIESWHS